MFFKLYKEGKIGFKQLTEADLGRTIGNTTHIGLFGDILTFLPNSDYENEAMFLYNKKSEKLLFSFDRINRKNGEFNSPKIKSGGRHVVSVVTTIKGIANNPKDNKRWFLLWFGLESEEVVFWLFNSESEEFSELSNLINLTENVKGRLTIDNENFDELINYIEKYVNENNIENIRELEIASQIGISKIYRPFDLDAANLLFKETGKKGELLIANYLENQKSRNQIFNYTWYNKSLETGLPL